MTSPNVVGKEIKCFPAFGWKVVLCIFESPKNKLCPHHKSNVLSLTLWVKSVLDTMKQKQGNIQLNLSSRAYTLIGIYNFLSDK